MFDSRTIVGKIVYQMNNIKCILKIKVKLTYKGHFITLTIKIKILKK